MSGGGCSVGVDAGGTTTRVVAFDAAGTELGEAVSATPPGAEACLANIAAEVDRLTTGHGPTRHVGVGLPGRVTLAGEVSLALNVGIDEPVDVAGVLRGRLGVPVVVENDVNAAAVAALAAIGSGTSLTLLSIGTGFAAGTIVDGAIVRGSTGVAGEIGHVPLPGETDPCVCGQLGCIEAIVSGRALSEAAAKLGLGSNPTVVDLWDAATAGVPSAVALRRRAVTALAFAAQLAVLMLDVDHVVFGGGVSVLGERLVEPIRADLAGREARSPWLAEVGPARRIRLAPADGHLGAVGADLAARTRLGSDPWKS
jgi:glucokinase